MPGSLLGEGLTPTVLTPTHVIDSGNPLTNNLVGAWVYDTNTSHVPNIVTYDPNESMILTAATTVYPDLLRSNGHGKGSAVGLYEGQVLSTPLKVTNTLTAMWFGTIAGPQGGSPFEESVRSPRYFWYARANGLNQTAWGFRGDPVGLFSGFEPDLEVFVQNVAFTVPGVIPIEVSPIISFAMTYNFATNVTNVYKNGIFIGTHTWTFLNPIQYATEADIEVGYTSWFNWNSNITTSRAYLWNRVLTGTEIGDVNDNPDQLFQGGASGPPPVEPPPGNPPSETLFWQGTYRPRGKKQFPIL